MFAGVAEHARQRFGEAATHLERALFLEPRAWLAALLLIGCYTRTHRPEAAEREQRRARRLLEGSLGPPLPAPRAAAELMPSLEEAVTALLARDGADG